MNKSIEGTADDEEEGVSPDTAIRSGLELLKVLYKIYHLFLHQNLLCHSILVDSQESQFVLLNL